MIRSLHAALRDPLVQRALFRGAVRALPTAAVALIGWWLLDDALILGVGCFLAGAWGFSEFHLTIMRWALDQFRDAVKGRR